MRVQEYIFILLLIISVLAIDIHFSSSNEEYSMYNSNWNGTSGFIGMALDSGAVILDDYSTLPGISNSTLLIIEPEEGFSPDDLRNIRDFKNNIGNLIIISDETGLSSPLLKVLGTDLSVEEANLSSVDMEYNNPGFIICSVAGDDILLSGVDRIALNKPSIAEGGVSLISSSLMSWIDKNGNNRIDSGESMGKYSILVKSENVYLISDSGIFQNAIFEDKKLKGNSRFLENILHSSEDIYIGDKNSKISNKEEIINIIYTIRQNGMIKAVAIIIIILLLLFIYRGKYDR